MKKIIVFLLAVVILLGGSTAVMAESEYFELTRPVAISDYEHGFIHVIESGSTIEIIGDFIADPDFKVVYYFEEGDDINREYFGLIPSSYFDYAEEEDDDEKVDIYEYTLHNDSISDDENGDSPYIIEIEEDVDGKVDIYEYEEDDDGKDDIYEYTLHNDSISDDENGDSPYIIEIEEDVDGKVDIYEYEEDDEEGYFIWYYRDGDELYPVSSYDETVYTSIDVDISEQTVLIYQNEELVYSCPCITGTLGVSDTPVGEFYIQDKLEGCTLNGYDLEGKAYSLTVSFWIEFYEGCGFHDTPWRASEEYVGDTYITNGSLGCVNVDYEDMANIFELVNIGDAVSIHY